MTPQPAVRSRGGNPLSCPVCCPVSLLPTWFSLCPSSSMTSGTPRVSLPLPGPHSFCFLLLQGSWAAGMTPHLTWASVQDFSQDWADREFCISHFQTFSCFCLEDFYYFYFQSVSYCLLFNVSIHMSVTILTFTDLWVSCTIVKNSAGGGPVGFLVPA